MRGEQLGAGDGLARLERLEVVLGDLEDSPRRLGVRRGAGIGLVGHATTPTSSGKPFRDATGSFSISCERGGNWKLCSDPGPPSKTNPIASQSPAPDATR